MVTDIWNKVLDVLKTDINKQSFDMWLKDTDPVSISDESFVVRVVDDVAKLHISDQYGRQIEIILADITGKSYKCEFVTDNGFSKPEIYQEKKIENPSVLRKSYSSTYDNEGIKAILNPRYTFENFVIGPNNQLAHAAADSVAHSPATQYNPLFLYGGAGLGKTHLMQAIGHYVIREKPYLKVLYVPTEQFLNEFIYSIRTNTTESFKIRYRDVDILMIDDIQFLEKKEETQSEFFHTFNTLYENKKQIIISSDRPPKQLSTLTERLRTRFEWGMITDIQPPNLETREAILRNKAENESINISDEALNYIAKRIRSSIRALEAALNRLKMVSSLMNNEQITILHAKTHLRELFDEVTDKKISISDIISRVAEKYTVSVEDIKSKSRQSRIVQPRFVAMYLSRNLTPLTTTEIGKEFGDRDHSTVVNAVNKIEEDIKRDLELKEMIDDLTVELKNY